jgi:hypothetical protein
VDDRIHATEVVNLLGESSGLRCAANVADDYSRGVRSEVSDRRSSLSGTRVQDDVMALIHEGMGGGAPETVGRAGNEDTGQRTILPPPAWLGRGLLPDVIVRRTAPRGLGYLLAIPGLRRCRRRTPANAAVAQLPRCRFDGGCGARLPDETLPERRVCSQRRRQDLHGDLAAKPFVMSKKHRSHALADSLASRYPRSPNPAARLGGR